GDNIRPPKQPKGKMQLPIIGRSSAVLLVVAAIACTTRYSASSAPLRPDAILIRRDIAYLASDALEGRLTGTPGNDMAAAYIAQRYKSLGLTTLTPGYLQRFDALSAEEA